MRSTDEGTGVLEGVSELVSVTSWARAITARYEMPIAKHRSNAVDIKTKRRMELKIAPAVIVLFQDVTIR